MMNDVLAVSKKRSSLNRKGVSLVALVISLALSAVVISIGIYFVKSTSKIHKSDVRLSGAYTRNHEIRRQISRDLANTSPITGLKTIANSSIYREPALAMPTAADRENIQLWTELFGDIEADVRVYCVDQFSSCGSSVVTTCGSLQDHLCLGYQRSGRADVDSYADQALKTEKYFFVSNAKSRSLVQRKNLAVASNFAACGAPAAAGGCITLELDRAGVDSSTAYESFFNNRKSSLRVANRVQYQLDGTRLLRSSSDGKPARVVAENIMNFEVLFGFRVDSGSTKILPPAPGLLKHPMDPAYRALCSASGAENCVSFQDAALAKINLVYDLGAQPGGAAPGAAPGADPSGVRVEGGRLIFEAGFTASRDIIEANISSGKTGDAFDLTEVDVNTNTACKADTPEEIYNARCWPQCASVFDGSTPDRDRKYGQYAYAGRNLDPSISAPSTGTSDYCECFTGKNGQVIADRDRPNIGGEPYMPSSFSNTDYARNRLKACMRVSNCDANFVWWLNYSLRERWSCFENSALLTDRWAYDASCLPLTPATTQNFSTRNECINRPIGEPDSRGAGYDLSTVVAAINPVGTQMTPTGCVLPEVKCGGTCTGTGCDPGNPNLTNPPTGPGSGGSPF